MADAPTVKVKRAALYKMVSYKGTNTGMQSVISGMNSLGQTLNSISLNSQAMVEGWRTNIATQISNNKALIKKEDQIAQNEEKRDKAKQVEEKKRRGKAARDDAENKSETQPALKKIAEAFKKGSTKAFGGLFSGIVKIAKWLFTVMGLYKVFDWVANNPDKVEKLFKGLAAIGKFVFKIVGFLAGSSLDGLTKFLENPISLKGLFGALQFIASAAPLFLGLAFLKNPIGTVKAVGWVISKLGGAFGGMKKAALTGIKKGFKLFKGVAGGIQGVAKQILPKVGKFMRGGGGAVLGSLAAGSAAAMIVKEQGGSGAEIAGAGVGAGAGQAIGSALGAATGIPGMGMLAGAAGAFLGGKAGKAIGGALEPVIEPIKKFVGQVGEVFGKVMEPIGKAFGDFFVVLGDFMSGILKAVEPHLPMITKILGIGVKTMFFPLFLGMKALTTVLKFFTPGGGANSESEYTEETSTEDTYSHEGGKELKDMMEDSRTADSDYKYDPKEEKSKGGFYDGFAKGGWINGPQSGYPVSLDGGKSTSFIGHGKEYVAQKSSGGAFVVPFDTPATRKNKGLTSMRMRQALMGGFLPTYSKGGKLQEKSEGGEVDMDNLVNMGMDAMKQHFGITNTVAPNPALQAELDEENNKKLPLGLKMTQDGQNIDLGRAAADQVRMVVDMAQDPKYAEKLKEIGKQYGYENMTAEQFKEIGEEIAQDVKFQTNQFIPGTESHRLAQVASSINSSGSRLESAKQDETSKKKELQVAAMSGGGGGVNVVNAPPIDTGGGAEDVPLALPGEERHDSHDYMMPKFGLIQESMINPSELM
tara:strand:+ start:7717 stop:10158 length:2442 start_codon:yes stop_codon:yes gene_type:complete